MAIDGLNTFIGHLRGSVVFLVIVMGKTIYSLKKKCDFVKLNVDT